MTHQEIASYALEGLKKAGADKAACKLSRGRKDEFNVEANKFTLMRSLFEDHLSLKVIKDGRKGVMIINNLEKDNIDEALKGCLALTESAQSDEAEDIADLAENKSFDQTIGGPDMDGLFKQTKAFLEQLGDEYPKIMLEGMSSHFNTAKTIYLNSNGVEFEEDRELYQMSTSFVAKDGEKSSSFNFYGANLNSLKKPFMDIGMHRTLIDESVKSLDPRMVEGKFVGQVIVSPACDDMIWQTLIDCFLSDRSLIEGISRWKDALETKVADSKLSMSFSPLHPDIIAGERFTPDGFESRNAPVIQEGVLKSFALSLYGARKIGKPRADNMAFGNIEVAPGNTSLEEMIRGIDRGILLNRFSGASPGPSGDVSGVAKNSFLIEKGKITDALKETMISFNILDILQNISGISSERCANGFSVVPWCCFEGITISGGG